MREREIARERRCKRTHKKGERREREREYQADSTPSAESDVGEEFMTLRSQTEPTEPLWHPSYSFVYSKRSTYILGLSR